MTLNILPFLWELNGQKSDKILDLSGNQRISRKKQYMSQRLLAKVTKTCCIYVYVLLFAKFLEIKLDHVETSDREKTVA